MQMLLDHGMKVRIYFNLHKHKWSIQTYRKGKGWRIAGHTDRAAVTNAEFKVYEHGRQKTIRDGQKNVHAYVIGNFNNEIVIFPIDEMKRVSYNPYKGGSFIKGTEPIYKADLVLLNTNRAVYV